MSTRVRGERRRMQVWLFALVAVALLSVTTAEFANADPLPAGCTNVQYSYGGFTQCSATVSAGPASATAQCANWAFSSGYQGESCAAATGGAAPPASATCLHDDQYMNGLGAGYYDEVHCAVIVQVGGTTKACQYDQRGPQNFSPIELPLPDPRQLPPPTASCS